MVELPVLILFIVQHGSLKMHPPSPPHLSLLPEIMSGSRCVHSIYTDYFSLQIAVPFLFFVRHAYSQVDICLHWTVMLFVSIFHVFHLFGLVFRKANK